MPIYEYRCKKCGKEFEELVLSGDETPNCPECGKEDTERLLSGFAVSGSGDGEAGSMSASMSGCGGSGGFT